MIYIIHATDKPRKIFSGAVSWERMEGCALSSLDRGLFLRDEGNPSQEFPNEVDEELTTENYPRNHRINDS
jgi:hypothetical protein